MGRGETEYLVEQVLRAKVIKHRGEKSWRYWVKWVGFNKESDNTWEPIESFSGSEHFVTAFWDRIRDKRDYRDLSQFNSGDVVFPVGPPKRKPPQATTSTLPGKSSEEANGDSDSELPSTRGRSSRARPRKSGPPDSDHDEAPPKRTRSRHAGSVEPSVPTFSLKRKRSQPALTTTRSPGAVSKKAPSSSRPTTRQRVSSPQRKGRSRTRRDSPPEVIEISSDSDEDVGPVPSSSRLAPNAPDRMETEVEDGPVHQTRAAKVKPRSTMPAHRHKAANPKVKAFNSSAPADGYEGAISVKAKFMQRDETREEDDEDTHSVSISSTSKISGAKAGPGRSSSGVKPGPGRSSRSARAATQTELVPASRIGPGPGRSSVGLKAGPGRSSSGVMDNGSLAAPKRGKGPSKKRTAEDAMFLRQRNATVPSSTGTGYMEVRQAAPALDADHEMDEVEESPEEPLFPVTGEELLDMAGLNDAAQELPDFEDGLENREEAVEEQLDLPEIPDRPPLVFQKPSFQASANGTTSAAWKQSTIFGPLTLGANAPTSAQEDANDLATTKRQFRLVLDSSNSLVVALKDVAPAHSSDRKTLDEIVSGSLNGPPGKLYGGQDALKLVSTFDTKGSSARVVIGLAATEDDQALFDKFRTRLQDGTLFIAMIGNSTLSFCSSSSVELPSKLGISSTLIGLGDSILVSEVSIEDQSAYLDAVLEAVEERW